MSHRHRRTKGAAKHRGKKHAGKNRVPNRARNKVPTALPGIQAGNRVLAGIGIFILALIGIGMIVGNGATPATSPKNAGLSNTASSSPALSAASSTKTATTTAAPVVVRPLALATTPKSVVQGDPVMVTLPGTTTLAGIQGASIGATPLLFTLYRGVPTAFYGTGINQAVGPVAVTLTLKNGKKLSTTFAITGRQRFAESLPVPDQIGGNSPTNQIYVESVLDKENDEIAAIPASAKTAYWSGPFAFPLRTPIVVTDPYGFNRETGETTIPHKGTDFKAASGTPVYAINDGVVVLTNTFVVYGNTVIVDHGAGIESLYMHLSRIIAVPGEKVVKGELLGYSGETGYAVGPHLHLSVKINGMSVDPMKFFALFGL